MKITYYGHSAFGLEMGGKNLLFDPFISPNPMAAEIDINKIPADYLLISHGHQDHVADAERIAKRTGAGVISSFEIFTWFNQMEIGGHPMNTGGKYTFDFGTVKAVSAIHSSVLPDGTYGANPMGFVIWNDEACFYYAGDTALTMDMKLIPMTCPKLDFAVLPIGDNFTMGYEDALIASDFIGCDTIIGVHFDTFGYIKIDHNEVLKAFAERGKKLILPSVGEVIQL
ncbi:MAG: metal-dependent hydrolase [Lewinellaceae bacterium]|nr:metal-dependent hydrolase [Lewinellaceae bacterium]